MKIFKSKLLIVLTVFIVLFGGVILYAVYGTPWDRSRLFQNFESYLETKYRKDFVVEDLSFYVIHGTYHAYAYEKGQLQSRFYVGQMHDGTITDSYTFEKKQDEATEIVTSILDEYVPDRTKGTIDYHGGGLEVNVETAQELDSEIKEAIKERIYDSGYNTDQIFFQVLDN